KIYTAQYLDMDTTADPGTVLVGFPCELRVATGQGALVLEEIQGASGKCLLTKDFLCGCHIETGPRLYSDNRVRGPALARTHRLDHRPFFQHQNPAH
ncbi:MAG: hypothetical protein JRH03_16630, partial [Deltaproteobacteria bacterium]|nr:hypothetical protein [Deltaproteobacteria bacterium]